MTLLNYYRVEIVLKAGIVNEEGAFYKEEEKTILKENDSYACLDDHSFTTLSKTGDGRFTARIGKPSIYSHINDNCFGTEIVYSLYSLASKRKATIKKEIALYINQKFGCFGNVDLSFLDKET